MSRKLCVLIIKRVWQSTTTVYRRKSSHMRHSVSRKSTSGLLLSDVRIGRSITKWLRWAHRLMLLLHNRQRLKYRIVGRIRWQSLDVETRRQPLSPAPPTPPKSFALSLHVLQRVKFLIGPADAATHLAYRIPLGS